MYAVAATRLVRRTAFAYSTTTPPTPSSAVSNPRPQPGIAPSRLSLDILAEQTFESTTSRTGARSSKHSLSSIERRRRLVSRATLGVLALGLGVYTVYLGRNWDAEELKAKNWRIDDAPSTRWGRTKSRVGDIFDVFNKPIWNELLPPLLPPQYQKPLTLVLSIDDLLVTSTWDRQHGWRTAKRPGVDYFLAYLAQFYEIVIFTSHHHYTAIPILEKLDPYNFHISYKLFRDATRSADGKMVKDLSYLNRDLSKVIMLDTCPDHVSTHPENSIVLPKWKGDVNDRGLVAMIPFLESIGIYKPDDVRPILQAFAGEDIPCEYARREAEAKQKHLEEWRKARGIASGEFNWSSLFGGRTTSITPHAPSTYLEQRRLQAQQHYLDEQAYIRAHKADFEKERLDMARGMSESLWGALNVFTGTAAAVVAEGEK